MIKLNRISDKQIKLIVVVVVVVVVVGVLLWGMVPNEIYEVSDVFENLDELDRQEISVRGVVQEFNITSNLFSLVYPDSLGSTMPIKVNVNFTGSFPDGFGNNQTVIVKGVYTAKTNMLSSRQIIIGCPSKY